MQLRYETRELIKGQLLNVRYTENAACIEYLPIVSQLS